MFNETDTDVGGYADDNTPYYGSNSMNDIIQKLNESAECLFSWFANN